MCLQTCRILASTVTLQAWYGVMAPIEDDIFNVQQLLLIQILIGICMYLQSARQVTKAAHAGRPRWSSACAITVTLAIACRCDVILLS